MLVDFNHAQSVFVILIDNCLDTCGFTSTAVTKQQYIVGFLSLYKSFCIVHQLFLLDFVSYKVVQHHRIHIVDCAECKASLRGIVDTECLVQTKHTNTIIFIESGYRIKEFFFIFCSFKLFAQRAHFLTYIFVVHEVLLMNCFVIRNLTEAIDSKITFNRSEIIIK